MTATLTKSVWWLCGLSLLATAGITFQGGAWDPGIIRVDALSLVLGTFVTFVSGIVHSFSLRYMDGDARQLVFFRLLAGLTGTVLVLLVADNVVLFILAWTVMGLLLAHLIGHVRGWRQASAAGGLAERYVAASSAALTGALTLLAEQTGSLSLHVILGQVDTLVTPVVWLAGILVVLAAVIQSALWPFHSWLLSSMTAPTPVSAFMHAGLVNAGGFLLIRMAPLLNLSPALLTLVFVLGGISAFVGTALMLVQNDIKRSLGCSTVAQMGFMVMQCGLGFYTAAIAHLMLHGLFKACLFLGAGSALENPALPRKPSMAVDLPGAVLAIVASCGAAWVFAVLTGKTLWPADSGTVLVLFVVLASLQAGFSFASWRHVGAGTRFALVIATLLVAVVLYAGAYELVNWLLSSVPGALAPRSLNPLHLLVGAVFIVAWVALAVGLHRRYPGLYVQLLNAAQPDKQTVLTDRRIYSAR